MKVMLKMKYVGLLLMVWFFSLSGSYSAAANADELKPRSGFDFIVIFDTCRKSRL